MGSIVLNSHLPLVATKEYDNKILFVFLIIMFFLVTAGLLFVDLTKNYVKNPVPDSVEKSLEIPQQGRYV